MERRLRAGELTCPSCGAVLAPWGHGRPREVRGDLGARLFVRPRRSRCMGCRVTHVPLPEMLWPWRADAAEVIGAGLEMAALGMGHRQIPVYLGLSDGTVRGWIRRFRSRAETVRRHFCRPGRARGRSGDARTCRLSDVGRRLGHHGRPSSGGDEVAGDEHGVAVGLCGPGDRRPGADLHSFG
ncbi:DUF6431 domain-containing protein [Streptomyces griseorubiginosus]|uniref:DUF6431 domain-containing protein n=1 Tax=Streptomyces griseorubiginosus TaxID=67304 RepID=UPI0033BED3A5